ncbi:MAG: hypothetical protein GW911_27825 [Armatimonadetes bacterium]|nr:hypothetical protein [Armatimonadota bacterium]NCQ27668.1 hypothetical protein [Armatimonadota bacterium]NDK15858.1 hypothetical protein [Armatimonadota bacterium]
MAALWVVKQQAYPGVGNCGVWSHWYVWTSYGTNRSVSAPALTATWRLSKGSANDGAEKPVTAIVGCLRGSGSARTGKRPKPRLEGWAMRHQVRR